MRRLLTMAILLVLAAPPAAQTADRLHLLDCGHNSPKDQSTWSPGVNEGKPAPFKKDRPMKLLTGDFDVFGDSSATLLSTPGHTPGHQSLLVHLGNTGWVVLTGDAAHFKDNWDNDRVPSINSSPEQTHA